jgi:hypothetical protein
VLVLLVHTAAAVHTQEEAEHAYDGLPVCNGCVDGKVGGLNGAARLFLVFVVCVWCRGLVLLRSLRRRLCSEGGG